KVSAPGRLILHPSGGPHKYASLARDPTPLGTLNSIEFTDASGCSSKLYFGMNGAGGDYEAPPRPPSGAFDVRYESNRFLETNDGRARREQRIHLTNAAYPVIIKWTTNRQPFPASLSAG